MSSPFRISSMTFFDLLRGVPEVLRLRDVPFGKFLGLRTTTSQKCEAVPRRARI